MSDTVSVDAAAEILVRRWDDSDVQRFLELPDGERVGMVRDVFPGASFGFLHELVDRLDHELRDDDTCDEWGDYDGD